MLSYVYFGANDLERAIVFYTATLGALGMPGQTAHVGMIATGRVAAGSTIVRAL